MIGLRTYAIGGLAIALLALMTAYALQRNSMLRLNQQIDTYQAQERVREQSRQIAIREAARAAERERKAINALENLKAEMEGADLPVDPAVGELLRCLQQGRTICAEHD